MKQHRKIPYTTWTRKEVLEIFRERVRRKLPMSSNRVSEDISSLPHVVKQMFGTWKKIYDVLGIKPEPRGIPWSRQRIISEMRKIYQLPLPARAKVQRRLNYLWTVADRYFPSRKFIIKKFGFPVKIYDWSRPRIVKYLRDRVNRHQPINTMTILRKDRFFYRAARYHYGSYQKAVEAAGFNYKDSQLKIGS